MPACHYIYRKAACHNFLSTKSYGINQPIDDILKSTITKCGNHGLQYKVPILQTLEVITIQNYSTTLRQSRFITNSQLGNRFNLWSNKPILSESSTVILVSNFGYYNSLRVETLLTKITLI